MKFSLIFMMNLTFTSYVYLGFIAEYTCSAKVIGNKSLYVKLNPTTNMTSVLKNEKSICLNHTFLSENIGIGYPVIRKKFPISEFIK